MIFVVAILTGMQKGQNGGQLKVLCSSNSFIYQEMHFIPVLENIKIYIKTLLLHVSVYNHHQGAYIWA